VRFFGPERRGMVIMLSLYVSEEHLVFVAVCGG
jgi:hypothetical protein